MGGQQKPFDPESNAGSSFDWVSYKLKEGCYWRCMPQG